MQRHRAVSVHVSGTRRPRQRMVRSVPQKCHVVVWVKGNVQPPKLARDQRQGTRHFRERMTWVSQMSYWQVTLSMPPFPFLPLTPHKRWTVSQRFPIPGIQLAYGSSDFLALVKHPKPTQWNVGLTRMNLTALSLGRAQCRVVNHTRRGPWGTYVPNSCPTQLHSPLGIQLLTYSPKCFYVPLLWASVKVIYLQ